MFMVDWYSVWNVAFWTLMGVILIMIGYRLLEVISPLSLRRQIEQGNAAAGIVAAGMFIAVAVLVGLLIRR